MSRASRSAGLCATAAATRPFASAAKRWRRTGIASWRWRSVRCGRVALPNGERCPAGQAVSSQSQAYLRGWVDVDLNMRCPLLAQRDKAVGDNGVEGDLGRDMALCLDTAPGQDLDRVSKVLALIDDGP